MSEKPAPPKDGEVAALIERLRERVLKMHGGTADIYKHHWNLTEADSALHREAADALARLSAPVQLQAHQNAFWNKHGMPSMLPSSCFKCGHVGEPSTTHAELPNVYICKGCAAAPVSEQKWAPLLDPPEEERALYDAEEYVETGGMPSPEQHMRLCKVALKLAAAPVPDKEK